MRSLSFFFSCGKNNWQLLDELNQVPARVKQNIMIFQWKQDNSLSRPKAKKQELIGETVRNHSGFAITVLSNSFFTRLPSFFRIRLK